MGFHLMKTLKVFFVGCLLFGFAACIKKKPVSTDLGNEASVDAVGGALGALQNVSPLSNIQKGDKVLFHHAMYLATLPRSVSETSQQEAIVRDEDEELYHIEYTEDANFYKDSQLDYNLFRHYVLDLFKDPDPAPPNKPVPGIKYYNLQNGNFVTDPPVAVQQAANCRGVPGCKIQVSSVDFDQIFEMENGVRKIHWTFQFSPSVPALANPIATCQSALIMVSTNQNDPSVKTPMYIRMCNEAVDYIYGVAPSSSSLNAPIERTIATGSMEEAAMQSLRAMAAEHRSNSPAMIRKWGWDRLFPQ